jgi:hypothetical protein
MLAMEVAFSTIKGLIGIGEVGSCVAMVAAEYNRRGTRYGGGRRGAAYRVRWGELLLNSERRTLNQYIVIHLSSWGSSLSTYLQFNSAACSPPPRTSHAAPHAQPFYLDCGDVVNFQAGENLAAIDE